MTLGAIRRKEGKQFMEKIEEIERAAIFREKSGGIVVSFPIGEWSLEQWNAIIERAQEFDKEIPSANEEALRTIVDPGKTEP
jgi:hypothetical protein